MYHSTENKNRGQQIERKRRRMKSRKVPKEVIDKIVEKHLVQIFRDVVMQNPEKIALEFKDESLSYQALEEKSNQIASFLLKNGFKPGEMVGMCVKRSLHYICWMFGIMKMGAIYLPIVSSFPRRRIDEVLEETSCTKIITNSFSKHLFVGGVEEERNDRLIITIEENQESIFHSQEKTFAFSFNQEEQEGERVKISTESTCCCLYTSGSTGVPKCVLISSQNISHIALCGFRHYGLTEDDKYASYASVIFSVSLIDMFTPLLNGITLVIFPQEIRKNPIEIRKYINKRRITCFHTTPVILKNLPRKVDPIFTHRMTFMRVGGEPPDQETMKFWSEQVPLLICSYGMTESTGCGCLKKGWKDGDENSNIGNCWGTFKEYIVRNYDDENMDNYELIKQPEIIGELWLEGLGISKGYLKLDDQTRFLDHNPFTKDPTRILRTGDLCKYNRKMEIIYCGRFDHQKKIRGYRINLLDIERKIRLFETNGQKEVVKNVVCGIKKNEIGVKLIIGYIILFDTFSTTSSVPESELSARIKEFLKERLPEYMIPEHFLFLKDFPKTVSGKIDRLAIDKDIPVSSFFNTTNNNNENKYIKYIRSLITLNNSNNQFRELGTDSISTVMILNEIKKKKGREIFTFADLMDTSIERIIDYLSSEDEIIIEEKEEEEEYIDLSSEFKRCEEFKSELMKEYPVPKSYDEEFNRMVESPSHILVTGSTGFLGSFILRQMLQKYKHSKFYLLVRSKEPQQKQQRCEFLIGDLSELNLGLESQIIYDQLVEKVEMVVHIGALVNHFGDLQYHYKTNVSSFYPLMKICKGYRPFVYISTIAVFSVNSSSEDILHQKHNGKKVGYYGSKWITDCLISKYFSGNSVVVRPPFIMGDTRSGKCNIQDWMSRLLQLYSDTKCVPVSEDGGNTGYYNSIQVDTLSKTILMILSNRKKYGNSYNCVFKNISFVQVSNLLVSSEKGYKGLEWKEWISEVEKFLLGYFEERQKEHPFSPFFEKFRGNGRIGNVQSDELLSSIDLSSWTKPEEENEGELEAEQEVDLRSSWRKTKVEDLELYIKYIRKHYYSE